MIGRWELTGLGPHRRTLYALRSDEFSAGSHEFYISDELNPCPFCGGFPAMNVITKTETELAANFDPASAQAVDLIADDQIEIEYAPACSDCGATINAKCTRGLAADAWNRRAG